MMTNYARGTLDIGLTGLPEMETTGGAEAADAGLLQRLLVGAQQFICGLHGHDQMLHFEGNRMFLKCTTCGHETPGWAIDDPRPRLRFDGEPQRHSLAPATPLGGSRKVA